MACTSWSVIRRIGHMMGTRAPGLAALMLAMLCGVAAAASDAPMTEFGIALTSAAGQVKLYTAGPLPAGATVSLQYLNARSSVRCCRTLAAEDFEPAPGHAGALESDSGALLLLHVSKRQLPRLAQAPFAGIAVVHGPGSLVRQASARVLQTNAAGRQARVARACFSAEGLHVKTFEGSKQLSDLYLGLGYAVGKPNCPEVPGRT